MKNYKDLIINIIYLFTLNIILSIVLFKNIEPISIIFYLTEATILGSIIKLLANTKNNKLNKTITIALLGLITIVFTAQFVHYKFYECFFSFYSLTKSGQIFAFTEAIIKIIKENILIFMIFILMIITIIPIQIKILYIQNKKKNIISLCLIPLALLLMITIINLDKTNIYSRYNLIKNTHNNTQNVKKMGLITSSAIDLKRFIIEFNPNLTKENKTKYVMTEEDDIEYNVTNINFDSIIKNTKDKDIKKLSNYLKNETPTNKNDYTGMFEGKNLIFITAESFNFNIIDKEITPTLYKLKNEGITFTNFYTPIYYASTSDGEYTNLTGLVPEEGTWSYLKSQNNTYPYSYANMLKDKGYKTYSYHNGEYDFYERNKVQTNFGFETYKGCGNGLEKQINCNIWPQSDEEMFEKTFNDYKENEHFIAYYMTLSGHLSHNFNTNDMAKKWQTKTEDLDYSENVKAYISGNIDLDKGLELLIENLKKENLLNDTVIVITPDHFPYGLSKKELKELQTLDNPYDLYQSGLIIYNPTIKAQKIDKLASNIDILPTLLNMFNVKYDSRLIIGKDIMSNTESLVIFNDGSFLTEKGFYNGKTNTFSNKKISNTYIKNKQLEVYNKINASSLILNKNYYKYIEKED